MDLLIKMFCVSCSNKVTRKHYVKVKEGGDCYLYHYEWIKMFTETTFLLHTVCLGDMGVHKLCKIYLISIDSHYHT